MAQKTSPLKAVVIIVVLTVIAVAGYKILTLPDQRTPTDRLGDAIHELPNGLDKASRELEDRTPGQKLGDAIEDAGAKLKDETAPK